MQKDLFSDVVRTYQRSPQVFLLLVFIYVLVLTGYLYWPGISGGFIFDDFPSLKLLDLIPVQSDASNGIVAYLDASYTGPTKRPVSMLSFLIEYSHWPESAAQFKRDNILLHLITTLAVAWLTLLVARRAGNTESTALLIAVLAATLFSLHPLMVSTVLYVVQRMAILAALFTVLALVAFLKGVGRVEKGQPDGWLLLLVVYPLLGVLGLFSKENGVLVALLAGVLIYFMPIRAVGMTRVGAVWLKAISFLPAVALLLALAVFFAHLMATNPNLPGRNFTIIERLMTQPRILLDYIAHIFLPRMQSGGVYNDGIVVSRSLLDPLSTVPAMVVVSACIVAAFWQGRRHALLGIAVAGFFAAHLVESTFIGLELYYEHRNYLPCVFLFMGVAAVLVTWIERQGGVGVVCTALVLGLLALFTHLNVQLWANTPLMFAVWAEQNPESERAQMQVASYWAAADELERAQAFVAKAQVANPLSPTPMLFSLAIKCREGKVVAPEDIEQLLKALRSFPYHQSTYNYLREVTATKRRNDCPLSYDDLALFVEALFSGPAARAHDIQGLKYFELGNLMLAQGRGEEAVVEYTKASAIRRDMQVGLVEVAGLASAGFLDLALGHSDTIKKANDHRCAKEEKTALQLQCDWIDSEINRVRAVIKSDPAYTGSR